MSQQMVVTRNPDGSHHPAYNEDWPERLQVEWAVGVAAVETGLRIQVTAGSHLRGGVARPEDAPETYHLRIQNPDKRTSFGTGPRTAGHLYEFLDGMQQAFKVMTAD